MDLRIFAARKHSRGIAKIDEELLAAMDVSGVVPNSADHQRRIDELLAEGLCYREKPEGPNSAILPTAYRLSIAGKVWLLSHKGN